MRLHVRRAGNALLIFVICFILYSAVFKDDADANPILPEHLHEVLNTDDSRVLSKHSDQATTVLQVGSTKSSPGQTLDFWELEKTLGTNKKRDWHNRLEIALEHERKGFGENGAAYDGPGGVEERNAQYARYAFDGYASSKISLNRSLSDIRHPDCQHREYLERLPSVSIIIPFINEHFETLVRTVHSCQNRAPPGLIHEVILADDFSDYETSTKPLEDYFKTHWSNVKVVRATKREGLIRTRLMGAKAATGEVLIFLDSHVECNVNWLPPLIELIAMDYKNVVCPFIDYIDARTFKYSAQDEGKRGSFDWILNYKRLPRFRDDLLNPSEPFKSPVMAGGLFAISSKWFWELGGYDPGLDIWGAEQYELSFKLWQCGGQMFDAPCSRIGHIYRDFAPWSGLGSTLARNNRRVAIVWMDEYAEYVYKRLPHYRDIDAGDLKDQLAVREKLKCKSFKWYLNSVAFDQQNYYPLVEPKPWAHGELRNVATNMCVETATAHISMASCLSDGIANNGNQDLEISWHHDVRLHGSMTCFDVPTSHPKSPITLYSCHNGLGNQHFKYVKSTQQMRHVSTNQCMEATETKEVFMNPCKPGEHQAWVWAKFDVAEYMKSGKLTAAQMKPMVLVICLMTFWL